MKKIYLLLMHTYTIPSKIVKLFTGYKYSHVAISLDADCNIVYSFGRRTVNSAFDGGFCIESKNGPFFNKFNRTICKIYEVQVTEDQYENIKNMLNDMKNNIDSYKYDYLGAVFRFLGLSITFKNKFVCSYFIAYLLQKNDIYAFNKQIYFLKPKDFEMLKGFTEIYSGKYLEYRV